MGASSFVVGDSARANAEKEASDHLRQWTHTGSAQIEKVLCFV
jgi:hypothetical protein